MAIDTAQITQVSDLVSGLARQDVSGLSHDELLDVHAAVARLGRLTGTLQARLDGEIAQRSKPSMAGGGVARGAGFGDAGKLISKVTGGTAGGARRSIEAGEALGPVAPRDPRTGVVVADVGAGEAAGAGDAGSGEVAGVGVSAPLPKYPAVAAAALAGELSVDAAGLIASGLNTVADRAPSEALHVLERALVDKAKTLTAQEVRRLVARAIARFDEQGVRERERRNRDNRYVAWSEDHTGMVTFHGKFDAVTAAPIRTVIEQVVTAQFRARRDSVYGAGDPGEQDRRTVGQMRADALADICRHALGCKETETSGIRTSIVVRMNLEDLTTGLGLGSIDGTTTPVSVAELRRLAGDAGLIPEVLGGEGEVLDLGRTTRLFTKPQRIALVERDGGCAKCHAPPEHCEAHHIDWWQYGGPSDLSNGVMLCTRCHHDIHDHGWQVVVHHGQVEFIPPPKVDPTRRPRPGGLSALDINIDLDIGNTNLRDPGPPWDEMESFFPGHEWLGEDFYADDEEMIRAWERGEAHLIANP